MQSPVSRCAAIPAMHELHRLILVLHLGRSEKGEREPGERQRSARGQDRSLPTDCNAVG